MIKNLPRSFDVLGNIALVKFPKGTPMKNKKKFAEKLIESNRSIKTVLEKIQGFKGRLRKQKTKWIAGEKTKEVLYRENGCIFRFNIDKTYFSPRLSNERKEIASMIKGSGNVLVMFSGVGPYPIVIAKKSRAKKIIAIEINREANKYAKINIELNKVKNKVEIIQGSIKKVFKKIKQKFDYIIMPRPQLKDSFLKEAFLFSKKNTMIYYYDFCKQEDIKKIVNKVNLEAKKSGKKIKILKVKKAGEIAPYKFRVRIDFKVL
ncbi:MAG: methyltransferase domain-containing protein [Candidatus Pacearchaeota archaeon]